MSVAADPEDIDMSQADAGVTLLNENAKQSSSDSTARSDEKGIDIIDENIDSCQSLEFGLNYETDHFTTGGTLELKDMISIEISYDAALFGKDFIVQPRLLHAAARPSDYIRLVFHPVMEQQIL